MAVIALSLWMMYHNDNTGGPRVTYVDQYDQSITSYAYISQRYSHFWIHPYPKRYGKCRMRMLGSMRKRRFIRNLWRIIRQFDATLGYPGEGPGSSVAAILSKYASFVHPGMTRRCRRDKDRDVSSTSHDPVTVCSHKSSDDHIVVANDEVLTAESSSGSSESRVPSVSSIASVHSIYPDSDVHYVRSESISATSSSSSSSNDNDHSDHIREILKKYSHHMITNTGHKKQPKPNDECKSNIDSKAVDQSVTITDVSDDEIDEAGDDNIGPDIEGSSYEAEFDNHEEPHVPVDDCSDDDGPYQDPYADVKVSESILQDVKTQLCFLADDGKDDSVADDDSCDSYFSQEKFLAFSHLIGGVTIFGLTQVTSFWAFFWLMMAHCFFYVPHALGDERHRLREPQGRAEGLRIRPPLGHDRLDRRGLDAFDGPEGVAPGAFGIAAVASLLLGGFCLTLPHTPPAKNEGTAFAPLEAIKLLAIPSILVLFIVTFFDSLVHNCYFVWTGRFLTTLGLQENWVAKRP